MELLKLQRLLTQFLRKHNNLRLSARTSIAMMRRLSSSSSQNSMMKLSLKMVKTNLLVAITSMVMPQNISVKDGIRLTQRTTTFSAPKPHV